MRWVKTVEVIDEAVVRRVEVTEDEGVSESVSPDLAEDAGRIEHVVSGSNSSRDDGDRLSVSVLEISGEGFSSDDIDEDTSSSGGGDGSIAIAEVILSVNFSSGGIDDDSELISSELFLLDGGSNSSAHFEKIRNNLSARDSIIADKGLDGLEDGKRVT